MFKKAFITVLCIGSIVLLSSRSFAEEMDVKILRKAAKALQESHPALAQSLKELADEESGGFKNEAEGKDEAEGDAAKDLEDDKADIKLLRDAAAALKDSHSALSKKLTKLADEEAEDLEDKEKDDEEEDER